MEVILLEKIRNLGDLGDNVNVKAGYGRNFLIPQNRAVFATKKNVEIFEQKRAELEKKAKQKFAQAEQRASKLNDITITIQAQASDEGKLYGSVGPNEIQHALEERKLEVDKREIIMPEVIHNVGEYLVEIHLHTDVIANLQVVVEPA